LENVFQAVVGMGVIDKDAKGLAAAHRLEAARRAGSVAKGGGELMDGEVIDLANKGGRGEGVGDIVFADEGHLHFGFAVGGVADEIGATVGDGNVLCAIITFAADAEADDAAFAGFGHAVGGGVVRI